MSKRFAAIASMIGSFIGSIVGSAVCIGIMAVKDTKEHIDKEVEEKTNHDA